MMRADVVDLYELLKPKLGEQESKALLHFVEDRTITLVQDEIAKGLVTKDDLARLERATKEEFASLRADIARLEHATQEEFASLRADIVRLEHATKEDIARLERATQEEFASLRADIARLEHATKEDTVRLERATKEDIARLERATKEDIVRLERATKEDIVRLEKEMLTFKWQMRVYLLAIAALIVLTNPRVLDLTARLLGITAPGP